MSSSVTKSNSRPSLPSNQVMLQTMIWTLPSCHPLSQQQDRSCCRIQSSKVSAKRCTRRKFQQTIRKRKGPLQPRRTDLHPPREADLALPREAATPICRHRSNPCTRRKPSRRRHRRRAMKHSAVRMLLLQRPSQLRCLRSSKKLLPRTVPRNKLPRSKQHPLLEHP